MARMTSKQFDRRLTRRARRRFGAAATTAAVAPERLAVARRAEIVELAEFIAEDYFGRRRVEPVAIVQAKGMTLSFNDYGDGFDGMLEYHAGHFHIFCNTYGHDESNRPRSRFTLAHELGHYFLDEHRNALIAGQAPAHRCWCGWHSINLAEQEADQFAAALLMPRRAFLAEARRVPRGLIGIRQLAERFATSLTATALRWCEMNLSPCAVVKWNRDGYAWKRLSSPAFAARYRRTIETPEHLPPDGPTARLLAAEAPPPCGYIEAASTAATWFAGLKPGDPRDLLLIEQAVSLGRHGILTLLYPAP